jgi:TM2 domain-containing membrane protein YozV
MIIILILGQFELAESLYARGYYDLAAVEYQRVLTVGPETLVTTQRRLDMARAMIRVRPWAGIEALTQLADEEPGIKPRVHAIIGDYFLSIADYPAAASWLEGADDPGRLGYAFLYARRPDLARGAYEACGDQTMTAEIDRLQEQPRRSGTKAMVLSLVCPGAGEIYAGNIRLGVTDFLLNAGTGYLLYNAFRRKKYVDAGLIVSFLVNRFYFGSIRNARRSAEQANEKKYDRWLAAVERTYFNNAAPGK